MRRLLARLCGPYFHQQRRVDDGLVAALASLHEAIEVAESGACPVPTGELRFVHRRQALVERLEYIEQRASRRLDDLETILDAHGEALPGPSSVVRTPASRVRASRVGGDRPRVLIGGPPKTGNVWVERLLADILDLEVLTDGLPAVDDPEDLARFVASDRFPAGSIFHQHYMPDARLVDVVSPARIQLVAVLRNPYDTFVSQYFYVQNFAHLFRSNSDPASVMLDKPIDHPDVLRFIEEGFRDHLAMACAWARAPAGAIVLSYEELHEDPVGVLRAAVERFGVVDERRIERAVARARPDRMRRRSRLLRRHVRSARVGDWREHLDESHLRAFRAHAELVRALGYAVE